MIDGVLEDEPCACERVLVEDIVRARVGDEIREPHVSDLVAPGPTGLFAQERDAAAEGQVPDVELSGDVGRVVHRAVDRRRFLAAARSALRLAAESRQPVQAVELHARRGE